MGTNKPPCQSEISDLEDCAQTFQIIIWKIKSLLKNSNKSMLKCWNSEQMEGEEACKCYHLSVRIYVSIEDARSNLPVSKYPAKLFTRIQ